MADKALFSGKLAEDIQFVALSESGTTYYFASDQELDMKLRELEQAGDAEGKWFIFQVTADVRIRGTEIRWTNLSFPPRTS